MQGILAELRDPRELYERVLTELANRVEVLERAQR